MIIRNCCPWQNSTPSKSCCLGEVISSYIMWTSNMNNACMFQICHRQQTFSLRYQMANILEFSRNTAFFIIIQLCPVTQKQPMHKYIWVWLCSKILISNIVNGPNLANGLHFVGSCSQPFLMPRYPSVVIHKFNLL